MSAMMTLAPSRSSTWQTLLPIPLAPPVTIATLPTKSGPFSFLTASTSLSSLPLPLSSALNALNKQHNNEDTSMRLSRGMSGMLDTKDLRRKQAELYKTAAKKSTT
uniref:Uncharacterized protein n=1 Tax=Ixodes ricinus TaxID=34613 RepID=A0A6B0UGC4_IXORI